jgi:hypothetical protein
VELHDHEGGAVVRHAHVADGLVEGAFVAGGLGGPVDGAVVLAAVVAVVGDVP